MESIIKYWNDHPPAGRWALIWLGLHLLAIALVAIFTGRPLTLWRLIASTIAVAICYILARRGLETVAAVGLCVILSADFQLSAISNYIRDDAYGNLVTVSAIVIFMAGDLLGKHAILLVAGTSSLILLVAQAQLAPPGININDTTLITYLALAAWAYYYRSQAEQSQVAQADFEQRQPQGVIGRYDRRADHVRLRLDTRRGERLWVRLTQRYFDELGLRNGNQIIIDRYEIRADDGNNQYIQALSISKVDQTNN